MPQDIKFNKDIDFYPDGIVCKRGKKGETYKIPDNLVNTIKVLNGKEAKTKNNAPENKAAT